MKRLLALTAGIFALTAPSMGQAGFDWQPATQDAGPSYQPPSDNIAEAYGMAAPDVVAEPLEQYQRPQSQPQLLVSSPQPVKNLSGGLFIDPYPLRNAAASGAQAAGINAVSVEQAMIENARVLNPLPLGAGMKTGAQASAGKIPPANLSAGSYNTYAAVSNGLTPMRGGEPTPLPGSAASQHVSFEQIHYDDAVGFGRDLPLALALSQVIPSGFTHSYANGIDAGATVSWEGGRPWNEVLQDMLKTQGMAAQIDGRKITVYPL